MMPELIMISTILLSITLFLAGAFLFFLWKKPSYMKFFVYIILLVTTLACINTLTLIPVEERTATWVADNITYTNKTVIYGENPYNWLFYLPLLVNVIGTVFYGLLSIIDYIIKWIKSVGR